LPGGRPRDLWPIRESHNLKIFPEVGFERPFNFLAIRGRALCNRIL